MYVDTVNSSHFMGMSYLITWKMDVHHISWRFHHWEILIHRYISWNMNGIYPLVITAGNGKSPTDDVPIKKVDFKGDVELPSLISGIVAMKHGTVWNHKGILSTIKLDRYVRSSKYPTSRTLITWLHSIPSRKLTDTTMGSDPPLKKWENPRTF